MAVTQAELLTALRAIVAESPGDFVYEIRNYVLGDPEHTGDTWDHPRVKAWAAAVQVVERYVREAADEG